MSNITEIIENQRKYYGTNKIKDIDFRIQKLKQLKKEIKNRENDICSALQKDLGKHPVESYMVEIGMVLDDLGYIIKHVRKWAKKEYHLTPLSQFPSISYQIPESYGVTLVISPWNYPFLLTMQPLIGAISAGNCVVVKPSEFSPNVSDVIKDIIRNVFEKEHVTTILGDKDVCTEILENKFDYIFYTGSTNVGKIVMQYAAKNLTPVTLELGGKSPCIVDKEASLELTAKRIVFGKLLNCGQTCVAPDYILVHKEVKSKFIDYCKMYIEKFLGDNWRDNEEYPKMVNEKHFNRILSLINKDELIYGGESDKENMKIQPTLLDIKDINSRVMQEEIFGPILPIIEYEDLHEAINYINSKEKPLALYLFTNNKGIQKRILKEVSFGGGCINDTIIHLACSKLGFGGVGNSGIGEYHGKYSFKTFSHYKSILKKSVLLDLPMRYHPYKKINDKLIRMFMK